MNEDGMAEQEQPFESPTEGLNPDLADSSQLLRLTLYPVPNQNDQVSTPHVEQVLSPASRHQSLPKLLTRSFLPLCVLHLLSIEPRYGNEILGWLRQRAGLWAASPGTVYPLLQQMESEGFITGRWEPGIKRPRHVYEITEAGRENLRHMGSIILPQIEISLALLAQLLEEIRTAEN